MIWISISIIILFILITGLKVSNSVVNDNKKNLDNLIKSKGFLTEDFRSHNNSCAVVVDKENEELNVFYSVGQDILKNHTYKHTSCKFSDIIESEVVIDTHTITKTARGGQILGAAVGVEYY